MQTTQNQTSKSASSTGRKHSNVRVGRNPFEKKAPLENNEKESNENVAVTHKAADHSAAGHTAARHHSVSHTASHTSSHVAGHTAGRHSKDAYTIDEAIVFIKKALRAVLLGVPSRSILSGWDLLTR